MNWILLTAQRSIACTAAAGLLLSADTSSAGDASTADSTAGGGTEYVPFKFANLENQLVRVEAFQQIQKLRKSADFTADRFGESCAKWSAATSTPSDATKVGSLYVESAGLAAKVEGRKDDHAHATVQEIGKAIHADICQAIAEGAKAGAVERNQVSSIDWHVQVVDKGLQHFFYISLYDYLVSGYRKGYDEGVGYYGMSLDGEVASGLAATVKSRDGNCGTSYGKNIWAKLLEGRDKLDAALQAAGKQEDEKLDALTPELEQIAAEIDGMLLEVLAISMAREAIGIQKGDKPEIKLIEGRMFWQILKPFVAKFDADKSTTHTATFGQWDQDDPAQVKPDEILAAVKAIWLDVESTCNK